MPGGRGGEGLAEVDGNAAGRVSARHATRCLFATEQAVGNTPARVQWMPCGVVDCAEAVEAATQASTWMKPGNTVLQAGQVGRLTTQRQNEAERHLASI